MGAVVAQPSSTIMAEIALANEASGAEEIFFPGEAGLGEIPQHPGSLQGNEGKLYTFIPLDQTPLSQKTTEYFSEKQQPKEEKFFDPGKTDHLSYKEPESIRTKEFQVKKIDEEHGGKSSKRSSQTLAKTDQAGQEFLKASGRPLPTPLSLPREMMQTKTASPIAKPLSQGEKQIEKPAFVKGEKEVAQRRDKSEGRTQQKNQVEQREGRQSVENRVAREQEKTDDRQEQQKRKEEQEEGFCEDEHRRNQDQDDSNDRENKVEAVEKKGLNPEEVLAYAADESRLLTELLNMRVNHFDVLVLFIEVMKISLKGREQERKSRMQERELQLQHIQNMVDNFKQQGKWMLFSNLGAGVLAIASGLSPIVGHMKGDWIRDKLGGIFSSLQEMEKDKFFEGVTKMTFAMSEMYKSTGQIQNTFAESGRTYDQHMAEIRKTDWEEETRTMDELKEMWKNMESFLHQSLQMHHDAIRQLYS
ncbi:MAG: hypothetical protein JJU12_07310 [Chlamydiales bacterium]|nr:hypothetical protein [Chlamydiales bacterium]